mmetsp:Transcript_23047/g.35390  ORF Transcript_23047/g.35390 Transcript_23047/m.35390 type:complete len:134 (-) Transcript_23047:509-910(-)
MQALYHLWSYSTWSVGERMSASMLLSESECCVPSFSTNVKTSFSSPSTTAFSNMSQYPNPTCNFSFNERLSIRYKILPIYINNSPTESIMLNQCKTDEKEQPHRSCRYTAHSQHLLEYHETISFQTTLHHSRT